MRFTFNKNKSGLLRNNPKRKIGFEEVIEIWNQPYIIDQSSDDPEQYRAIGWVKGQLYSVIFEERADDVGEYIHLVTLWKSTKQERKNYEENI